MLPYLVTFFLPFICSERLPGDGEASIDGVEDDDDFDDLDLEDDDIVDDLNDDCIDGSDGKFAAKADITVIYGNNKVTCIF